MLKLFRAPPLSPSSCKECCQHSTGLALPVLQPDTMQSCPTLGRFWGSSRNQYRKDLGASSLFFLRLLCLALLQDEIDGAIGLALAKAQPTLGLH